MTSTRFAVLVVTIVVCAERLPTAFGNRDAQTQSPAPQMSLKSGVIPEVCQPHVLTGSPYLLDCWLNQNPKIAGHIVWRARSTDPDVANWALWNARRKADLREAFAAAVQWYKDGMTNYTGFHVDAVPPNMEEPWLEETYLTVLDESSHAWPLFVAHVAFSLAAEIHAWVPWSLRSYDDEALQDLLTMAPGMFMPSSDNPTDYYHSYYKGFVVTHDSTPTHPRVTFKFMKQHALIASSPAETIARVLEWSRSNLVHYAGSPFKLRDWTDYWHYRGAPPVARVLSGTVSTSPQFDDGIVRHYTFGCSGTADFLVWLLRPVNVPARRVQTKAPCVPHTLPYFSGEKTYLTHGDDPYSQLAREAPMGLLPIDAAKWHAWFDPGASTVCNVGRRPAELSLTYIPVKVVGDYCLDVLNGKTHANGLVFENYSAWYTVAQLEAVDLWGRLAAKVPTTSAFQCAPLK